MNTIRYMDAQSIVIDVTAAVARTVEAWCFPINVESTVLHIRATEITAVMLFSCIAISR